MKKQKLTRFKRYFKEIANVDFKIKGMTCAMGCAKTIKKKLALEGKKAKVILKVLLQH